MRVYGHSYRDTMSLPMRAFWHLSGTIPRLMAGEHKDSLELMTKAQNPEAANELYENLRTLAPEPVKMTVRAIIEANSVRDEDGLNELRRLAG